MAASEDSICLQYYMKHAYILQQSLPPQVRLKHPVVLYDALDKCFVFHLELITSAEVSLRKTPSTWTDIVNLIQMFMAIIEERTYSSLEERYKEPGSAKIRNGEFVLQDVKAKRRFNLQQQAWNFIMKPGTQRYMSITFRETGSVRTSCPHCGVENASDEDQMVTWYAVALNKSLIVL